MESELSNTRVCQNCGNEFDIAKDECPNCGTKVKNEENDTDNEPTIVIKTFSSEFEAEIAQGILKEEGIESFISKDDEGSMNPALQLTLGVKLHIFEKDRDKVIEILDSVNTDFDMSDGENDSPETEPGDN